MNKVLCIAEVCSDIIFGSLPSFPQAGEEVFCEYFDIKAGGGANTAMGLAALGVPTRILANIGNDKMGDVVMSYMERFGVDTTAVKRENINTPVSAVLSTSKDRCFASYAGTYLPLSEECIEREIRECSHVHTYTGYCHQYPIIEMCRRYGKTISVDTSFCETQNPESVKSIISQCDIFTPSRGEALKITDCENIEDAMLQLSKLCKGTVITMDCNGAMAMDGNTFVYSSPKNIGPVLDSTGAGDLFCSGYIYGFIKKWDVSRRLEFANMSAGVCVTYYGGIDEKYIQALSPALRD